MKSQTAAESGRRRGARPHGRAPSGTIKLFCVSDEEAGGILGAKWLTQEHPDLARCDYLLNEGGGSVIPYGDRRLYGVCAAEKGTFRFAVTARGTAGHASVPGTGENALLKLTPALEALGARRAAYDLTEAPRALLEALGEDADDLAAALERIRSVEPRFATLVEPTFGVTMVPTRIRASEKINVIPAHAELRVDCRVPPGMAGEATMARIREVLGEAAGSLEIEFTEQVVGNRSPVASPLMDAIAGWIDEADPGAEAVPTVLPAFTDSRWWRDAFPECVAYGFCPHRHMTLFDTWPLIHSADERIDVRDLGVAASFFHDLPERLHG
jgi:acetylornithine deacetylase/succinyl-diaminopimelate desuccinylase-like protein